MLLLAALASCANKTATETQLASTGEDQDTCRMAAKESSSQVAVTQQAQNQLDQFLIVQHQGSSLYNMLQQ